MLKDASVTLASSTHVLTSVARTKRSLEALDRALTDFPGKHHLLQLDWDDRGTFLDSLAAHIKEVGAPDVVVAWLHDDSLGPEVARVCALSSGHCDFFQVRGSSAAAPHREAEELAKQFKPLSTVTLHQIILGFITTPSGSRWLRNGEISQGVLGATQSKAPISIVGVVEPWSARP